MGPIDQIKVNSQTSPIEASSPPMSNGHTRGGPQEAGVSDWTLTNGGEGGGG